MAKTTTELPILDNTNTSSTELTTIKQTSKETFHQCKICGGPALHSNFGAMTCSPCKMFFKRNAEAGKEHFTCDFGGQCEININNRNICPFCRLSKCFTNGMQIELIRCSTSKKNRTKQNKKVINQSITTMSNPNLVGNHEKHQLQQFPTSNLLRPDQSTLTIDQWKLFSNLMLCYDEHSGLSLAERFISQQNILPIKLRFKCGSVNEFLSSLFGKAQLLFEKNRDFHSLCLNDRSILLHRQMKHITIISSSFIAQQSHLFNYPAFSEAIESLFGAIIIATNKCAIALLCFDVPILKLVLAILCFSSFDYTIYENVSIGNLTNMKPILQIQDMYIELAWRYLVYVYDDKQATVYFSNLIRYILTVIDHVILMQGKKTFIDMINLLVERTVQTFTVNC